MEKNLEGLIKYGYAVMFAISEKTGCGSNDAEKMLMNTEPNGTLGLAWISGVSPEDMADKYIEHSKQSKS